MKVLAVPSYSVLGGAELVLARNLAERPDWVEPRAVVLEPGPLVERLQAAGVDVVVARQHGRPSLRSAVTFTRGLVDLLRADPPDVVWAINHKAATLCAPACRITGVPIVWQHVNFALARLSPPLAASVNGVITVSHALGDTLGPFGGRRLLGVAPPRIHEAALFDARPQDNPPTIGTLARAIPFKGHDLIIRAGALLRDEFPEIRVVAPCEPVPEYPDWRGQLEALVAELGMEDQVELPGWTDNVREVLERLSVYVTATYRDSRGYGYEGAGAAMLEAVTAGIPVVALSGGGTDEGVVDGVTGRLVAEPSAEALAEAIRPFLRDPARIAAASAASREFGRARFSGPATSAASFELLAEMVAPGRPGGGRRAVTRTATTRPMKILVVPSYSVLGGAELVLSRVLSERPASVDVSVLAPGPGPLVDRLRGLGLDVRVAHQEARPSVRSIVSFTRALRPLLSRERPDLVWAIDHKAATLCAPGARLAGVPIVWHQVSVQFSWLSPWLAGAVNHVIAVSQATADVLGPLRDRRVLGIVPPHIDPDAVFDAHPADNPPTIGTLARAVPIKGHDLIIRAAALLRDEFPDLRVLATCDRTAAYPDWRDTLDALVTELGMDDRVTLLDWVESIRGVLEQLSIYITATYRDEEGFGMEGLSTSMLEAVVAGIPVVAIRGGGTEEGVQDGVTGRLVDEPSAEALAEALAPYLRDRDLIASASEASRVFGRERFAGPAASAASFRLLAEAIGRPPPTA